MMPAEASAGSNRLRSPTLLVLAGACGVAVGNVYFPQAVAPLVAEGIGASPRDAASLIAAVQIGYAVGNYLIVPLADRFSHRTLVAILMVGSGVSLLVIAATNHMHVAIAVSVVVGALTVASSIIGPMAALVTPIERQGHVNGTLLAGSIAGMLVARTAAGAIADSWGWRIAYAAAAAATMTMSIVVARTAPLTRPPRDVSYMQLLADPPRLVLAEPQLRRSCVYQATIFAGFTATWSTLALLITGPIYGGSATQVGLLTLVNAVTMAVTPMAGRWTDRRGSDHVNLVSMITVAAAAVILPIAACGGGLGWAAIILGTLALDVGMQTGMVANQVRVYTLRAEATSRMNTAYMTCAYLAGSAGSLLAGALYVRHGWIGPCLEVAALTATALSAHVIYTRKGARRA